jgi:hypothetical protein
MLVNGQISFNGTAAMAKWRLDNIVAHDREAVPAYSWRRVSGRHVKVRLLRLELGPRTSRQTCSVSVVKETCRWERRK